MQQIDFHVTEIDFAPLLPQKETVDTLTYQAYRREHLAMGKIFEMDLNRAILLIALKNIQSGRNFANTPF